MTKEVGAPYIPPKYEKKHVVAFKALSEGKATEHQQKMVLQYILLQLCAIDDLTYRPYSERDSVFAEGKRFIGLQIRKFLNYPMQLLKQE
jgi:hypothetical protein